MVILIIMHQFVLDEHMIDVIRANGIATACVTTGVVSLGDTVSYVCDTKVVGVIVKMYIPGQRRLKLCEVEVYGKFTLLVVLMIKFHTAS